MNVLMNPSEFDFPCNCFGTLGQFETAQQFHEMETTEGCVRKICDYPEVWEKRPRPTSHQETPVVRTFNTGATRDSDEGKPDFEGYFSPLVIHAYGLHMMRHQTDAAGNRRPSDNWQNGIPMDAYMKSGWRHFIDVWANHRGMKWIRKERIITAICALMFNVMGYLHEYLKANPEALKDFEKECGYGE